MPLYAAKVRTRAADFYKRKLSSVMRSFWLILIFSNVAMSTTSPDWIKESIELTINTRFSQAEALFQKRFAQGDSGIEARFYYASMLNSKMIHFENLDEKDKFLSTLDRVIALADDSLQSGDRSLPPHRRAEIYFYRGSAYGYRAYFHGRTKKWIDALDDAMKSIADLEEAVRLDSTLWEAYLGIGVYKYWRSTKLKYILWLPFVPDSREEGIRYIKKAITNGANSRYMAMHQLIYILLDFGAYDEAIRYAEKVVARFPQSQFMWWANAHAYFKKHDYEQAVTSYRRLLGLIEKDPEANPGHWFSCSTRLAEIYSRLGQFGQSRELCWRIEKRLSQLGNAPERRKIAGKIGRIIAGLPAESSPDK